MLERLQEAPSTRTVYVLGIPTARVPNADHITSYKARNKVRQVAPDVAVLPERTASDSSLWLTTASIAQSFHHAAPENGAPTGSAYNYHELTT